MWPWSRSRIKAKKSVGKIGAGKTRTVKIKLKPKKPGKIKASFKVSSDNAGGKTVKKKIRVVSGGSEQAAGGGGASPRRRASIPGG